MSDADEVVRLTKELAELKALHGKSSPCPKCGFAGMTFEDVSRLVEEKNALIRELAAIKLSR